MLLFRSGEEIDQWCGASGEPRGDVLTLAQVWNLARAWYGDRMAPDFRGRTVEQAQTIFAGLGLTSPFWRA
jgi:hypothetical protein